MITTHACWELDQHIARGVVEVFLIDRLKANASMLRGHDEHTDARVHAETPIQG